MKREFFRKVLKLTRKQPWIEEKIDELEHMLYSECQEDNYKQDMIIDLIERFHHLTTKDYSQKLQDLAEDIVTDPQFSEETCQLVAMAADASADSSQYILYDLKPILEKFKWRKYKQVNKFGNSYQIYKRSPSHKNIILIDEFIGSGKTAIGRVNEISKVYKSNGIVDFNIVIRVLASTEMGLKNIKNAGIDIKTQIVLNKGISDFYNEIEANEKIKHMIELESLLSTSYNERDMPSLGYGKTESLYYRENGNTPNSVFPIFWWPFYKSQEERPTLLIRAMGDA